MFAEFAGKKRGEFYTPRDVVELCRLSPDQAYQLLKRLVKKGRLCAMGTWKGAFYTPG